MSQTELHRGQLRVESRGVTLERLEEILKERGWYCREGGIEERYATLLYSLKQEGFIGVYYKDVVYSVMDWTCHSDYDDIVEAVKSGDRVNITLQFYNGGTWMGECLTEALDKLDNKI